MLGKEMEESSGEFWLPEDFLSDDLFVEENHGGGGGGGGDGSNLSSPESEAEDEYVAALAQKMALSFLLHERRNSGHLSHHYHKNSIMGTSPQSTLSGVGGWSYSGNGSPEGQSQVSSPPPTPFPSPPPPQKDDARDLLYTAAGQVARMRLVEQEFHRNGGILARPRSSQALIQQQLQAARFYQLRRQQLMKQQWARYHLVKAREEMGPLGLSNSSWPLLQKHHHQKEAHREPAARPMLISGQRRESKGTGVFLPRRAGSPTYPTTKPANSPLVLPARVVQALNLNLDAVTVNPNVPGTYLIDQEALIARGNATQALGNLPAVTSGHDFRLPSEWTY